MLEHTPQTTGLFNYLQYELNTEQRLNFKFSIVHDYFINYANRKLPKLNVYKTRNIKNSTIYLHLFDFHDIPKHNVTVTLTLKYSICLRITSPIRDPNFKVQAQMTSLKFIHKNIQNKL